MKVNNREMGSTLRFRILSCEVDVEEVRGETHPAVEWLGASTETADEMGRDAEG